MINASSGAEKGNEDQEEGDEEDNDDEDDNEDGWAVDSALSRKVASDAPLRGAWKAAALPSSSSIEKLFKAEAAAVPEKEAAEAAAVVAAEAAALEAAAEASREASERAGGMISISGQARSRASTALSCGNPASK